jgi:hypothetical protein
VFLKYSGIVVDDAETPSKDEYRRCKQFLHESSQHAHENAFENLWFGENDRGINGATPNDLMHAFLLGVVQRCLQVFFSGFTASEKAELDRMIDEAHVTHRSSESSAFPRCTFRKGITNLSLLTADEWLGVVFSLALVTMSEQGHQLLAHVLKKNSTTPGDDSDPLYYLQLWEMLLCFHAWYKRGAPYLINSRRGRQECDDAISSLLTVVKDRLPRAEANEWKLQKFHEMLHVPHDIATWGSPANYDAASGENMLIHFAKRPSKNALKRYATFVQDVNARLWEKSLLGKVMTKMPVDRIRNASYRERMERNMFSSGKGKFHDADSMSSAKISSFLVGNPKYFVHLEEANDVGAAGNTCYRVSSK